MYKYGSGGWEKRIGYILLDVVMLESAFALACAYRSGDGLLHESALYRSLAVLYAAVDVLVCVVYDSMGGVRERGFYKEFVSTLNHVVLVLCAVTVCLFCLQGGAQVSRVVILLTTVLHLCLGYLSRIGWKALAANTKADARGSMVLVADEGSVEEIVGRLDPKATFAVTGLVLSNRDATGERIADMEVVASLETAADYICREWVDEVFVFPEHMADIDADDAADGGEAEPSGVARLIGQCEQMAIPLHICLPLSSSGRKRVVEAIGGYSVVTSISNYALPFELFLKRALDVLGGVVGSLMALAIIAIVGPMIKRESPGPILFRQVRIGQNGRRFEIYKLRSMYLDAEERKSELLKDNRVSDGMMFKLDWDPRVIGNRVVDGEQVTGIGEFIRSHSLDEFPQFFNVLRGEMSLVGTRPPTVDEWERYRYHHRARLATKPGITGMWQVSGRSEITDFEEVVRLDTEYINNWSLGLDIKILLKTVLVVLRRDGAM